MTLEELSIADLSAIIGIIAKQKSKLPPVGQATPEQTKLWEKLSHKQGCAYVVRDRKINEITNWD